MDKEDYINNIRRAIDHGIALGQQNKDGTVASYIPELAKANPDYLACSVMLTNGEQLVGGDNPTHKVTLQSISKLVLLIGLMEEFGPEKLFSWINTEPSGQPFSSVIALEQFGPIPSNPLINAGAIALSDKIPGSNRQEKIAWLRKWIDKIFNKIKDHIAIE